MDFKFFIIGIKNIIFNPEKAWELTDAENEPLSKVRNSLFIPLVLLVSIATFAGSFFFSNVDLPTAYSIFAAIKCLVLMFITIYATAYVLGEITFPLDLGRNFSVSFRLIAYSVVPFFLCQMFSRVFESLLFINVLGFYGLYIFWCGTEKFLVTPQYKRVPLMIATAIVMIGLYISAGYLLSMLSNRIYYAFFV